MAELYQTMASNSPPSLRVTLRALRTAAGFCGLPQALDQEYRLALRLHAGHDFAEGVRAQVVDKDRRPQWDPPTVAQVPESMIRAYFSSLGDRELGLATACGPAEQR